MNTEIDRGVREKRYAGRLQWHGESLLFNTSASHQLVCIQPLLIDVVDHCRWQEVLDRHASADEKPYLCRADVVVDELLDHKNVAPVFVQDIVRQQELVHIRSCSLQNQTSVFSDNVVELFVVAKEIECS